MSCAFWSTSYMIYWFGYKVYSTYKEDKAFKCQDNQNTGLITYQFPEKLIFVLAANENTFVSVLMQIKQDMTVPFCKLTDSFVKVSYTHGLLVMLQTKTCCQKTFGIIWPLLTFDLYWEYDWSIAWWTIWPLMISEWPLTFSKNNIIQSSYMQYIWRGSHWPPCRSSPSVII